MKPINIGLSEAQRREACVLLNRTLCNESLLLIKTRKFYWDVVGPQFMTLHKLWDTQYEALSEHVDEIAERIRYFGGFPVGTAAGFIEHGAPLATACDAMRPPYERPPSTRRAACGHNAVATSRQHASSRAAGPGAFRPAST